MRLEYYIGLGLTAAAAVSAVAVPVEVYVNPEDVPSKLEARNTGVSTASSAELRNNILWTHNVARGQHHAPFLQWDPKLATYAQTWANKCKFAHTGGPYGENLYAVMPGPQKAWPAASNDAVTAWLNEGDQYNYGQPGFSATTGHFTQAVWKGTQKVGCAWNTVACNGMTIFMCEYYPAGNVQGQFPGNVAKS